MFTIGVALLVEGYGILYAAIANIATGGRGPTFLQAMGVKNAVAMPGSPNLTGQPNVGTQSGDPLGGGGMVGV